MRKIIITESQLKKIVQSDLDEDYPQSWNIEEFRKITSFNGRIKYCENNLQRISSGSSRIVYKIDETKVLKLAKNKKGLAQNESEISFSDDYMWDGMVAEVFEYDNNNLWVEMELATRVSPREFMSIVGIPFDKYCEGLRFYESESNPSKYYKPTKPDVMDEMWENEFTNEILTLIGSFDVPVGDLCRLNTYGIVKRNNQNTIVMVDYGLTSDVYDTHYKK